MGGKGHLWGFRCVSFPPLLCTVADVDLLGSIPDSSIQVSALKLISDSALIWMIGQAGFFPLLPAKPLFYHPSHLKALHRLLRLHNGQHIAVVSLNVSGTQDVAKGTKPAVHRVVEPTAPNLPGLNGSASQTRKTATRTKWEYIGDKPQGEQLVLSRQAPQGFYIAG